MRNKSLSIVLAVAAVAAVAFLANREEAAESDVAVNPPKPAPAWELKDLAGNTIRSADLKGKVVILDFWATWCPPCRAEIPGFIELQKEYQGKPVAIIGFSVDEGGADVVKSFGEKQGINYPIVLADEKTQKAFGDIEAIPTTFVIDTAGRIVNKHVGFTEKSEFEKEIQALLKSPAETGAAGK